MQFEAILRSLLGRKVAEVEEILQRCLSKETLFTPAEIDILKYVLEMARQSGFSPTLEYLVARFQTTHADMLNLVAQFAVVDDLVNIRTGVQELIVVRGRQLLSGDLLTLSGEVARNGVPDDLISRIQQIRRDTSDGTERPVQLDMGDFQENYIAQENKSRGLSTCVRDFDEATGGLSYGSVTALAAFVGSFKTTWALNIGYNGTFVLGYNIVYISLEVSREHLMSLLLSRHSFDGRWGGNVITHKALREHTLTPDQKLFVFNELLPDYNKVLDSRGRLVLLEESDFSILSFDAISDKLLSVDDTLIRETGRGIDAVVVDHIHMTKYTDAPEFRRDDSTAIMNKFVSYFRKFALDFRGTQRIALLLAQTNRAGWKRAMRDNGRYELDALSETHELERSASVVLTSYTDDVLKLNNDAKLCMPKNRFGPTISETPVSVKVDPAYCAFPSQEISGNAMGTTIYDLMVEDGGMFGG